MTKNLLILLILSMPLSAVTLKGYDAVRLEDNVLDVELASD